jgi:hypothetical protein
MKTGQFLKKIIAPPYKKKISPPLNKSAKKYLRPPRLTILYPKLLDPLKIKAKYVDNISSKNLTYTSWMIIFGCIGDSGR